MPNKPSVKIIATFTENDPKLIHIPDFNMYAKLEAYDSLYVGFQSFVDNFVV